MSSGTSTQTSGTLKKLLIGIGIAVLILAASRLLTKAAHNAAIERETSKYKSQK